ncbi:MAG: 4'-phosphopantetheinyl transferase superfamily protein [Flavobacteriaceae bacterium]|nr:4'-phosphopantetheinyl transferase superfamily protein [Flavobacteriaceae bacterium]
MIGNDIIDLQLAAHQSDWQRRGFLEKIFTKSEQEIILNSRNPFQTVWLLWSMKESVYKAFVQQHFRRFFNPKKLRCRLFDVNRGTVRINGIEYSTRSQVDNKFIHTIVSADAFFLLRIGNSNRQEDVYQSLLLAFSKHCGFQQTDLQLKKNAIGIPKIYKDNILLKNSVSISHHGNYWAFAFTN